MSNKLQPDWQNFVDLMREAGWVKQGFTNGNGEVTFYYYAGKNSFVYWPDGELLRNRKSAGSCGEWREWLEAGDTPPPF